MSQKCEKVYLKMTKNRATIHGSQVVLMFVLTINMSQDLKKKRLILKCLKNRKTSEKCSYLCVIKVIIE